MTRWKKKKKAHISNTFVWNSTRAENPVLAQLILIFPPNSTQGTVSMDLTYKMINV